MYKHLLALTAIAFLFTACGEEKAEEKWNSFIYPDKTNNKRSIKSPVFFKTLQECQKESENQLVILNITDNGTYKCGLNCEFHDGMKLEVCEKMLAAPVK
ncbi:hypothetical protein KO488_02325 [Poseidonibacter lekithochrous]|uniref:hypothetical protein n=1 Tax=Poseidonibacter TaxID=2321187 RepID=UPI001C09DB10|nr:MULTISPECIES: hypothetical protein [Poseidonibacter]MBU3013578.1 hypothetical protein [Poseidonibacter lekithochrous]MDO6826875.1 hypothetical protein [Poseidonibacter sp. 1_MG-2023]